MLASDTIVAPATPTGISALALVRVSGPDCRRLAAEALGTPDLPPRQATHREYHGQTGSLIDDVVAILYHGPNSYTGEDLLELSTHGNPLIVRQIIADLQARGCRLALPGEFTRRAFLHGRIDLSQAEAVTDVIHAQSERALAAAHQQLRGSLARRLDSLTQALVQVVARVEAYIDFPEEDLPVEDREQTRQQLEHVLRGTETLLATRRYGDLLREGLRVVLVGAPNAGKSTLLNGLLGEDRALVSPEPGTTRDYLEERLILDGHLIRLIDTAGLNPTPAAVEQLGIEKTWEQVDRAHLLLVVLDASRPHPAFASRLREKSRSVPMVIVLNKADLLTAGAPLPSSDFSAPAWAVSALRGDGLDALREAIVQQVKQLQPPDQDELVAINARHSEALQEAQHALRRALKQIDQTEPVELLAANLRATMAALGEIVGPIDHERVLDQLFAEFCIGK